MGAVKTLAIPILTQGQSVLVIAIMRYASPTGTVSSPMSRDKRQSQVFRLPDLKVVATEDFAFKMVRSKNDGQEKHPNPTTNFDCWYTCWY